MQRLSARHLAVASCLTVPFAACASSGSGGQGSESGDGGSRGETSGDSSEGGDSDGDSVGGECVHVPHVPAEAIAFYDFEGDGNTVIDVTGNGHDGALFGEAAMRGQGRFCTGLWSEGDDGAIVPHTTDFDFVDGYTLEMWAFMPDPLSTPRFHKWSTFTLRASHQNGLSYVAHESCFPIGGFPAGFEFDRWYHIAGTWDGEFTRYYVDAAFVGELDCTTPPVLNELEFLMGQGIGPSAIDDVALFDHPRSAEQICEDAQGTWAGMDCTLPPE